MDEPQELMSQADFARHCGVSRAAVSQWKTNDILREEAFSKPGKKGKLIVAVAAEHVRRHRDIGQSLGNGIATKTTEQAQPKSDLATALPLETPDAQEPKGETQPQRTAKAAEPDLPMPVTVEDKLKAAKLEEQLRRNRIKASEEAVLQGQLMATDDARDQMARIAGLMMQVFEGALPDFAAKVAAQFSVPQRDVLHLLRAEFRKVRAQATAKERGTVEDTDPKVETSIDLDS